MLHTNKLEPDSLPNLPLQDAIEVADLRAGYGKREVLHSLTLRVAKGETYGLIGLNGAGKTTLVKTILGLKTPTSGAISIFAHSPSEADVRKNISYLPERFDPPWFLKGGEFIDFAASLYNAKVSLDDKQKYCAALSLDSKVLAHRVQTYSKGMRQKLGLIATILTGANILILDEPMSGLDPQARALVKKLLMSLKSDGRTILLSSHILSDMDEICDHVSVIHAGDCPFQGQPGELKSRTGEESLERAFLKIINVDY